MRGLNGVGDQDGPAFLSSLAIDKRETAFTSVNNHDLTIFMSWNHSGWDVFRIERQTSCQYLNWAMKFLKDRSADSSSFNPKHFNST
jgi:hypothetical protein